MNYTHISNWYTWLIRYTYFFPLMTIILKKNDFGLLGYGDLAQTIYWSIRHPPCYSVRLHCRTSPTEWWTKRRWSCHHFPVDCGYRYAAAAAIRVLWVPWHCRFGMLDQFSAGSDIPTSTCTNFPVLERAHESDPDIDSCMEEKRWWRISSSTQCVFP